MTCRYVPRSGKRKGECYMPAGKDRTLLRSGRGRADEMEQSARGGVCIRTIILRGVR
jgi:hypothetical protein